MIFGSFGTVAAYRIPKRQTIVTGRSHCPNCDRTITWLENIPLFSYLLLGGRCRGCKTRIPVRYPLIEAGTGLLFGLTAWKLGLTPAAVVFAAFFWGLVVLTVIDLDHKLLPNRVVYPMFVAGWVGLTVDALIRDRFGLLADAAIGALIFGGFFLLIALIVPAGMGGGDVKLAFVLGTFLGYVGGPGVVLVGMFLSFLVGGVLGIAVMALGRGGRKTQIPFGPFLALGTALGIFWGEGLLDLYLGRV